MNSANELVVPSPATPLSPSERNVLEIILHNGPIARSALTAKTQLTQQSVHRIVDSLEGRRYLQFGEAKIVGRGKPSPSVSINPHHYVSAGLSISTENIRFCLLDLVGTPIIEETADVDPTNPQAVLEAFPRIVAEWRAGVIRERTLVGVGIAVPGYHTQIGDAFTPPEPLRAWQGIPIEKTFGDALELPAFAENNATSAAMAEHYLGDGSNYGCIVYLSFNNGFGSGIFLDRHPFRGGHGNAGEISLIFSPEEMPHRPALSQLIKRLTANGIDVSSIRELSSRFDPDWPGVNEWLVDVKPQLHRALRALHATIDPNAVFFGGDAPDALRKMLLGMSHAEFTQRDLPSPTLLVSRLPGDPAHLGAALLPLHQLVF